MARSPGERLGLYDIREPLGSGGMGEVYRARDTKLGRDVAVKVLPEHFAEDKDRMARFEREARVLASLNHPNIAAVYGLEESEGSHYLVMELVPGESLAAKIQRGPLSVDEVMRITHQLIDALEAAHENGVVHRDLKPANVQLTPDGHVKVLDFGLAKVETGDASTETSLSPTMTRDATQAGIILGTAPYMSPEQARGLPVDKRTDIFSFGCVVFEMLTGRKAFEGDLVSDVMAAVIKSEPNWSLFPRTADRFRKLLERCFEKEPKRRLRDIGDARVELEEGVSAPDDTAVISRSRALALAVGTFVIGAIAAALVVSRAAPPELLGGGATRFQLELEGSGELALSADGRTLAHAPGRGLWVRPLGSWESRSVPGIEDMGVRSPSFSPDGEWISFRGPRGSAVYKIRLEGGTPTRVAEVPRGLTDVQWTEQGTILISASGGIWEVPENGGNALQRVSIPETETASAPLMLPGGDGIVFQHWRSGVESIAVCDLRSGEVKPLVPLGRRPRYLAPGRLLYVVDTTLMAGAFDLGSMTLSENAVPVMDGVAMLASRARTTGAAFDVSASGTLVYRAGGDVAFFTSPAAIVDPTGTGESGFNVLEDVRLSRDLRVSPDGTRLAADDTSGENDIWIYEFARNTASRLTFDPGEDETPAWSPDGRYIAFAAERGGRVIFRVRSDGSEDPETLWESEHHAHVADWSADGKWLVLDVDTGDFNVWILDLEGEGEPRPLLDSRFDESMARISPDGRYLAYASNESGRSEIYMQRFPDLGDKRQLSNGGGVQPVWQRDGRRLLYRSPTHVMAVDVSPDGVSAPAPLVEDRFGGNDEGNHTNYDVLPDGRLAVLATERAPEQGIVNVVVNWSQELEARVPR